MEWVLSSGFLPQPHLNYLSSQYWRCRRPGDQGYLWPHRKPEATLGYLSSCLRKRTKEKHIWLNEGMASRACATCLWSPGRPYPAQNSDLCLCLTESAALSPPGPWLRSSWEDPGPECSEPPQLPPQLPEMALAARLYKPVCFQTDLYGPLYIFLLCSKCEIL